MAPPRAAERDCLVLMNGIEPHRKFEAALERARGKSLLILLSGHPDPDAIGSALAHRLLCEKMEITPPSRMSCPSPGRRTVHW